MLTANYELGFTSEADWSADAAEEVEVLYCDDTLSDYGNGDCYLVFVEDPSTKAKINV